LENGEKKMAYTTQEAQKQHKDLGTKPDIIAYHVITNDVKEHSLQAVCENIVSLVSNTLDKLSDVNIVLSLAPVRHDNDSWENKRRTVNALLVEQFENHDKVHLCANDNIRIEEGHINVNDRVHLTKAGTSRLAYNLKAAVYAILGLSPPQRGPQILLYKHWVGLGGLC
jgi:hypothetical protein